MEAMRSAYIEDKVARFKTAGDREVLCWWGLIGPIPTVRKGLYHRPAYPSRIDFMTCSSELISFSFTLNRKGVAVERGSSHNWQLHFP